MAERDASSLTDITKKSMIDNGDGTFTQRVMANVTSGGVFSNIKTSQNLSLTPMNYVTSVAQNFKLKALMIHTSVPITETIDLLYDDNNGNNYDTLLRRIQFTNNQDGAFCPEGDLFVFGTLGDKIKVTCTNANLTGTIYITLQIEVIG